MGCIIKDYGNKAKNFYHKLSNSKFRRLVLNKYSINFESPFIYKFKIMIKKYRKVKGKNE